MSHSPIALVAIFRCPAPHGDMLHLFKILDYTSSFELYYTDENDPLHSAHSAKHYCTVMGTIHC